MKMVVDKSSSSLCFRICSSLSTSSSSSSSSGSSTFSCLTSAFSSSIYLVSQGPLASSCVVMNLCLLIEKSRTMVLPLQVLWLSSLMAFSQDLKFLYSTKANPRLHLLLLGLSGTYRSNISPQGYSSFLRCFSVTSNTRLRMMSLLRLPLLFSPFASLASLATFDSSFTFSCSAPLSSAGLRSSTSSFTASTLAALAGCPCVLFVSFLAINNIQQEAIVRTGLAEANEARLALLIQMSEDNESRAHLANYNKVIDVIEETILFAFFLVIFFFIHFADSTNNFLFNNPVFLCGQDQTNITEEEDACPVISACTIQNSQSLTAQLHLYCGQQKANRNMIKSMKGVGLWIGIALVGLGVDHFGKKPFIKLAVVFLNIWVLFLLIGSFLNSNTLLTISLVSYGVGNSIVETISFIYITRFLPKQSYEKLTIASYFVGSGLAQLVFGLIRSVIASWLALVIVASVPIICVFILSFFLQEDPYYLLEQQRTAECQEVVRFIGGLNSASQDQIEEQLAKLDHIQFDQPGSISCGDVCSLLRANLELVWLVIVLGVTYMTTHITEASFSFTSQEIGYSYQSNISVLGAASIIGSLTFFFVITAEEKRQRGFVWSTTIEVLLSCLYLTPLLEGSKLLQVVLLFWIRLFKDWSLNFYVRLKVDCLSKSYQTSLTTAILLIGKTADVISPHLIQYQSDHHINVMVMNNAIKFVFGVCLVLLITEKYHEVALHTNPPLPPSSQEPK